MWQDVRTELHPLGLEIVTVGIDTAGPEACRPFIEAANPSHPSLVDTSHQVAERFGVVNIPNGVWIDEDGVIVRPAETAPAPRKSPRPAAAADLPDRLVDIFTEASRIQTSPDAYAHALRDWVANGAASAFALSPDEVIRRSEPRNAEAARGQAHFELAAYLEERGLHGAAVEHFREAHRLTPANFAYKRQAWSLEATSDEPLARFWQGPSDDDPASWPYESDWLSEVRAFGAENYYRPWVP